MMKKVVLIIFFVLLVTAISVNSVIINSVTPDKVQRGSTLVIYFQSFGGSEEDYGVIFSKSDVSILSKVLSGDQLVLTLATSPTSELGFVDVEVRYYPLENTYNFPNVFEIVKPTISQAQNTTIESNQLKEIKNLEADVMSLDEGTIIFSVSLQEQPDSIYLIINGNQNFLIKTENNYLGIFELKNIGLKAGDTISYFFLINGFPTQTKNYTLSSARMPNVIIISNVGNIYAKGFVEENVISKEENPIIAFFIYIISLLFGQAALIQPTSVGEQTNFIGYTVTILSEQIYNGSVYDYHVIFNGTVNNCRLKSPPWPAGWTCVWNKKRIEIYNENGDPLPIGTPINGLEIETIPPNATILDYWITTNTTAQPLASGTGKRIKKPVELGLITFEDCWDRYYLYRGYCPNETGIDFAGRIKGYIESACQKFQNALEVVENELDRIQPGIPADKIKLNTIRANKQRLADILRASLEKCNYGVVIECDTSWNRACKEDTNAYIPSPFGQNSNWFNLHICPAFCTDKTPEGTILHELTHFGGSIDDLTDNLSAHNLEDLIDWLDDAHNRQTYAYQ